MITIRLELEIDPKDLDSRDQDEDTQRDEVSSIAHQWAEALEKECLPKVRVRVLRSKFPSDT